MDAEAVPSLLPATLDVDLGERVGRALCAAGYAPLRQVEVTTRNGVIRLVGRVPSYYLKQVALTAARQVPGVRQVQDDIDVIVR